MIVQLAEYSNNISVRLLRAVATQQRSKKSTRGTPAALFIISRPRGGGGIASRAEETSVSGVYTFRLLSRDGYRYREVSRGAALPILVLGAGMRGVEVCLLLC